MRVFVYGGGLLLLAALGWAVAAVLRHRSFNLDNRCQQRALSCSVLASFTLPLLTLAFVSALFLLGRLWYLRSRYLEAARSRPQDLVPTAGSIIGDVVGRDELCRAIMADLRDQPTRCPHVVVGGIGTGKTALLVRLTELLASQHAVPVPVRLRDAQKSLDFRELARRKFLADLESDILSDNEGEKVWRQLLKEGRIVVLADGLEEALIEPPAKADRDNLIRLAIRQASKDDLPLIIASRPHGPLRGNQAALVELEPLSEEAALDYIQHGDIARNEQRIDWLVETAEVTEAPLYLQVARQLNHAGLLGYISATTGKHQLDTRTVDRAELRYRLLHTWEQGLTDGHFPLGVALRSEDRVAAIEQLSVLACMGLRHDSLEVKLEDFESLVACSTRKPSRIITEARQRLADVGHSFDVRLAATWGTQLQLVEAQENTVRFPHSILQAYLGSRLIGDAMDDRAFQQDALASAGRELLIALVMHSRAIRAASDTSAAKSGAGRSAGAVSGWHQRLRTSRQPDPADLPMLLCTAAGERWDPKALDLYSAALEIDSVAPVPQHQDIAAKIAANWQKQVGAEARTLENAKVNLVRRFGEAGRNIQRRAGQSRARQGGHPSTGLRANHVTESASAGAYRQLFDIACSELSYPVRLAATQEIGSGGDEALCALETVLKPSFPARDDQPPGDAAPAEASENDKKEAAQRANIVRAWLTPLLAGSATASRFQDADDLMRQWLDLIYEQNQRPGRERSGLSAEIALAQGFKYAANRRPQHPHAHDDARAILAEQAKEMLGNCSFWFTRLTLLHALTLWHLPDEVTRLQGQQLAPDYRALVAQWASLRSWRRRDRHSEHPFVAETCRLAVRALETGQPERYIWIDESGVVSKVGSSPARPQSRRKHNLWIPPSTGWTALNARAQQLVADVLLLLNLAERGEAADRDRRLARTNKNYLPPCIAEDRSPLDPNRPVGLAGNFAPGSHCLAGCRFGLCPYPAKGAQAYRQELSEAFCRRQQRLLAPLMLGTRGAPWQHMSAASLREFWKELGQPVPRTDTPDV